jgi:hypothetical protein
MLQMEGYSARLKDANDWLATGAITLSLVVPG